MTRPPRQSHCARGFSLVEVLVAIAIISVLVTAAYIGMRSLGNAARENQAKVLLQTARGFLDAFVDATRPPKPRPQPAAWGFNDEGGAATPVTPLDVTNFSLTFWFRPAVFDQNGDGAYNEGEPVIPLTAPAGACTPGSPAYTDYQVINTRTAMSFVAKLPSTRTQIASLPAGSMENVSDAGGQQVLMLDGWGTPLLFVPGSGLMGVTREGAGTNDYLQPIKSPDSKPFWASAGPDRDFAAGDDNLYSFEN